MFTRGIAACLSLAVAAVAQAGVDVVLSPDNTGPYSGGEVVTVDVYMSQSPTGVPDHLLRLVQFDFSDSHPDLGLSLPETHERGPLPGDEIFFWKFGGQGVCNTDAEDCGDGHFVEDELPGQFPDRVAIAYFGDLSDINNPDIGPRSDLQLLLEGDGSWLKIGTLEVTLPTAKGDYTLDILNANDTDPDMGAQVRWGFGSNINGEDITAWRASTGDVTGGELTFVVQPPDVVTVESWESVGTHGAVGDVGLEIPMGGMFSEPRICADRIVLTLTGAVNPATAIPANVTCEGRDVDGNPVACSAIGVATAAADTELVITFTPKLTDFARYRVAVSGLESSGGAAIAADERCFTMLLGDATGDRQVRANDVGGARSFVPTNPIDPMQMFQVRSDATCDGQVRANDVGGIRSMVPNNAQDITCP